jgi:hypothetical protein
MTGDKVEIACVADSVLPEGVWTPFGKSADVLDGGDLPGMSDASRRSNLVRRHGRPPRPSTDMTRTQDVICSAEVEANRQHLMRAFSRDIVEVPTEGSGTIAGVPLSGSGSETPLIYTYGFTQGQPEMAGRA